MTPELAKKFHWVDWSELEKRTDAERYDALVRWARIARGQNPDAFDALTEWMLDDTQWKEDALIENERALQGVLSGFREQTLRIRTSLKEIEPSGLVNPAVFAALDRFDVELSGASRHVELQKPLEHMLRDFALMRERDLREQIAGGKTGHEGTDSVATYGYLNLLKECDAQVQWALFMPDFVKAQQKGFTVDRFTYEKMPAMRFIGREDDSLRDIEARRALFRVLDEMKAYQAEPCCDLLFMHHYGLGVDVGPWHGVWGRFMKANTPVPDGFLHFDFVPDGDDHAGPPYYSQFAFATFSGDTDAMHACDGYDSDAMYDVTRNIILGQGVEIPYPMKYWTAEAFPNGFDQPSTAYLFSVKR